MTHLVLSFFSLVLQRVVKAIAEDDGCAGLQQNDWYLDDGINLQCQGHWILYMYKTLAYMSTYRNVTYLVKTHQYFALQSHTPTSHILRFWEHMEFVQLRGDRKYRSPCGIYTTAPVCWVLQTIPSCQSHSTFTCF